MDKLIFCATRHKLVAFKPNVVRRMNMRNVVAKKVALIGAGAFLVLVAFSGLTRTASAESQDILVIQAEVNMVYGECSDVTGYRFPIVELRPVNSHDPSFDLMYENAALGINFEHDLRGPNDPAAAATICAELKRLASESINGNPAGSRATLYVFKLPIQPAKGTYFEPVKWVIKGMQIGNQSITLERPILSPIGEWAAHY